MAVTMCRKRNLIVFIVTCLDVLLCEVSAPAQQSEDYINVNETNICNFEPILGTLEHILKNGEEVNKIVNNWSPAQGCVNFDKNELQIMIDNSFSNHLRNIQTTADAYQTTLIRTINNFDSRLEALENVITNNLLANLQNVTAAVTQHSNNALMETGESLIANISHQVNVDIQEAILPKINEQLALLKNITFEERNILRMLENVTISRKNSSQEGCQPDADPSASRLLHVTVPSSVRARPDAWEYHQVPEEDDLDKFMKNATGCEYMARGSSGGLQSVSNSTARGGTWRRRYAARGEGWADISITWGAGHRYSFWIGDNSNTETRVYDYTPGHTTFQLLQRASPGLMSQDKYTQFLYIQLEDDVMSFGALDDNTPWLRQNVTVSADDVIHMGYFTMSDYGVKLLVCA